MAVVYSNKKLSYRFSLIIRSNGKGDALVYQAHVYARNEKGTSFHGETFTDLLECYLDIIEKIIKIEQDHNDFEKHTLKNDLSKALNWVKYDNKWT